MCGGGGGGVEGGTKLSSSENKHWRGLKCHYLIE